MPTGSLFGQSFTVGLEVFFKNVENFLLPSSRDLRRKAKEAIGRTKWADGLKAYQESPELN